MEKIQTSLDEFLNETKVWKLATHDDPFVRRALYKLLSIALIKQKASLDPSVLSTSILTSGLHVKQQGSALDFAKVIAELSNKFPDVWTTHYSGSGRKSADHRLGHFLKRGSQGGPPEFWSHISSLLSNLPHSILTHVEEDKGTDENDLERHTLPSLLIALRDGINSKDEARGNQVTAWNTYLDAFELVQVALPESTDQQHLYRELLFPVLTQYVRPSSELSSWAVSGPQKKSIHLRACHLILSKNLEIFEQEWQALSAKVIEDLKISLPEQSKEYIKSQDSISAEIERWYDLQGSLISDRFDIAFSSAIKRSVPIEVSSALALVKSRNGKPYSAAAVVEKATEMIPNIVLGDPSTKNLLIDFANNDIPHLLQSPSAKHLIRFLSMLEEKDVSQAFENCLRTLLQMPDFEARLNALQPFISSSRLARDKSLSQIVIDTLAGALDNNNDTNWRLVMAAVNNPAAPKSLTDDILARMIDDLSINPTNPVGLRGLEMAANQREGIVKDFTLLNKGSTLIQVLLSLSESSDETISERARGLSSLVEGAMVDGDSSQVTESMLEIIERNIASIRADSLRCVLSLLGPRKPANQNIGLTSLSARRRNCWSTPLLTKRWIWSQRCCQQQGNGQLQ